MFICFKGTRDIFEIKGRFKGKGCPIYLHRVELSIVGVDLSHHKSSGENLA